MKVPTVSDVGPLRISGAALVLANLVPIFGVLVWNWSVFEIVFLYWAENLIIGFLNIFRMIYASKDSGHSGQKESKLFCVPFFAVHYGFFCFGHGIFVFAMLGKKEGYGVADAIPLLLGGPLTLAFAGLAVSHLISFFTNYIGQKEYEKRTLNEAMFSPYGRIVVLHIAIIFGGMAVSFLGSPIYLLLVLIGGKILMDLGFHYGSHLKWRDEEPERKLP